ncbi:hypothetical protein ACQ4PT_040951 [Festuca glaucescens]
MDLSRPESSDLSLGLHPHVNAHARGHARAAPLRLFDDSEDAKTEGSVGGGAGDEGDDEGGDQHFSLLGHSLCVKRPRQGIYWGGGGGGGGGGEVSSSSSSSALALRPAKRQATAADLEARRGAVRAWGNQPLAEADPDVHALMEREKERQVRGIELIASENFVCRAVLEALGSHLTNKYSEGHPGARYYGGNQHIDAIERLCHQRALAAFNLDPACWGVNVQPYSCTSANLAVYTGLLLPSDRIMGLEPPSGGHVSHGYYTPSGKKVSGASIFFESLSYKVNPHNGYIDYDKLEERAMDFHPKILICGGSSYPREWDFARMRLIADRCGAVLMCDMAHISGLVAAKECRSPFNYCDVVTSTTHKNLRGPRGGIIFFRRGKNLRKRTGSFAHGNESDYDFEDKINFAVFPSLQGGPHNNHIAALAITLKQIATPDYKAYIQQVKKNAQALASALLRRKCRLVTGGTDNHLVLWDLRTFGLTGKNFEKVCEMCHISINKTPIYGDNGSISPGGVRIGTPAMTTRGCLEDDFEVIADFLIRATQIAGSVLKEHGKVQKEFLRGLENNKDIIELGNQVEDFASQFAMPGATIEQVQDAIDAGYDCPQIQRKASVIISEDILNKAESPLLPPSSALHDSQPSQPPQTQLNPTMANFELDPTPWIPQGHQIIDGGPNRLPRTFYNPSVLPPRRNDTICTAILMPPPPAHQEQFWRDQVRNFIVQHLHRAVDDVQPCLFGLADFADIVPADEDQMPLDGNPHPMPGQMLQHEHNLVLPQFPELGWNEIPMEEQPFFHHEQFQPEQNMQQQMQDQVQPEVQQQAEEQEQEEEQIHDSAVINDSDSDDSVAMPVQQNVIINQVLLPDQFISIYVRPCGMEIIAKFLGSHRKRSWMNSFQIEFDKSIAPKGTGLHLGAYSRRRPVARTLTFHEQDISQVETELTPVVFSAMEVPEVKKTRGRKKKIPTHVTDEGLRRCTRIYSKLDGHRPAPVTEPVHRSRKRSKKSAPAVVENVQKRSGQKENDSQQQIIPETPVNVLHQIGEQLGIDKSKLTEGKLRAKPS